MKKYSLIGVDGNAFAIMAYVAEAFRESGRALGRQDCIIKANIDNYFTLAQSDDYNNLLSVSIDVLNDINEALEKAGLINLKKISKADADALLATMGLKVGR